MRRPRSTPRHPALRPLLGAALLAPLALASCATTPVSALSTGACFDSGSTGGEDTVRRVATVDCSVEHDSEVVGIESLPDGDYPGRDDLNVRASARCPQIFADYAGLPYEGSGITLVPWLPDTEGWDAGDRSIICVAVSEGPTTESLAG